MTALAPRLRIGVASALWVAAISGMLEGLALVIGRGFPAIQAAHKVPPSALWIAPVVQVVLLAAAAVPFTIALSWLRRERFRVAELIGTFAGFGALALFIGPGILHWVAVVVLSLAVGTGVGRAVAKGPPDGSRLLRHPWIPVIAIGLLATATTATERWVERRRETTTPAVTRPDAPDVVLLILDTIRRDRFHLDGDLTPREDPLPSLRKRALGGTVFANAWATSSWSLPSQATILTGRPPQRHRADWPGFRLADSVPTLAEWFRSQGYATGAFSSNDSWITPEYLGRGFNRFRTYRLADVWRRTSGGRAVGRVLQLFGRRGDSPSKPMATTTAEFLDFAAAHSSRPIFAYLCYMDANRAYYDHQLSHPFWQARPPVEGSIAAYDRELAKLDAEVDRLLTALERRGRLANTVLVVTSDHGESFGPATGDHHPSGHGSSLYPEQSRVPLTIIAPGRVPAGAVVTHPVVLTDLAGFVASLTGHPGAGLSFPARDLLLRPGTPGSGSAPVFLSLDYSVFSARSIVTDSLQFIWSRGEASAPEELFDLAHDPQARRNLAPGHPDLGRLKALVRESDPRYGEGPLVR
jgi:arylsulfatase A-like enzyme